MASIEICPCNDYYLGYTCKEARTTIITEINEHNKPVNVKDAAALWKIGMFEGKAEVIIGY